MEEVGLLTTNYVAIPCSLLTCMAGIWYIADYSLSNRPDAVVQIKKACIIPILRALL